MVGPTETWLHEDKGGGEMRATDSQLKIRRVNTSSEPDGSLRMDLGAWCEDYPSRVTVWIQDATAVCRREFGITIRRTGFMCPPLRYTRLTMDVFSDIFLY